MADMNHLLHDSTFVRFKEMLKRCTLKAACGNQYILVEKLTNWLRSIGPGSSISHAERLLHAVYRSKTQYRLAAPISIDRLCHTNNGCLIVFSILLEMGRGDLVSYFQRQGIDEDLPIPLLTLREKLTRIDQEIPDPVELAGKFDQLQWRYCPKQLSLYMDRELPDNTIIPIHEKEMIKTGGTAEVWKILVLEEFVSESLKKAVKSSGVPDPGDGLGYRYRFALKTFQEGNRSFYTNEKNAFEGLRNHQGMVRYLGDYGLKQSFPLPSSPALISARQSETVMKYTYNILLEYGELDLDDYFHCRLPPLLQIEVEAFWTAMLDVAEAIEGIHNLKATRGELVDEYRGWHADIKPDNILSVGGKFKLCDPGFAKFVKWNETDGIDLKQLVLGGTETYGAPERLLAGNEAVPVLQTIDTWSLGCVFSVAATWVVLGFQGIRQFSWMREKAIEKIIAKIQSGKEPSMPSLKLNKGDYFHDGQNVLTDIQNWHKMLCNALRKNDPITNRVLDLVDKRMLLGAAEKRWKPRLVCMELKRILAEALETPREQVPQEFMDALIAVDEAADSEAGTKTMEPLPEHNRRPTIADLRQARKSKRLDEPLMKTSHRSEARKSTLPPPILDAEHRPQISESPVEMDVPVPEDKATSPPQFPLLSQEDAESQPANGQIQSQRHFPDTSRPKPLRRRSKRPFQDVWQAREEITERIERLKYKLPWIKPPRDELLSGFFADDRDIKFLVDNAETMKPFWFQATYLLVTLVMKAVGLDGNGMDLYFTAGSNKLENQNDEAKFEHEMNKKANRPKKDFHTDMRASVSKILDRYLRDYRSNKKNLTIIVLTDGKWEGMSDKSEVKNLIVKFAKESKGKIGSLQHRPVSIEFIQFGDDADATYRLRQLDNKLKWDGIEDIIDTEPSNGDINKMLLGSFVEEYDEEDEEEEERYNEGESSAQRMDSIRTVQGTSRPERSSTLMSVDQVPRTILQIAETGPSRGHSRQNTLESPPSSPLQRYSPVYQPYRT